MSWSVSTNFSLPVVNVTIVNDLQYHDEALLRLTVRELVSSFALKPDQVQNEVLRAFKGQLVLSILADYFDGNEYMWKKFLEESWEISIKTGRGVSKKGINSPNSALDIEAMACSMLLSESFLASLSQASAMWSIYRNASCTLSNSLQESTLALKESVATAAARLFSKGLPCVFVNDTALDVKFSVGNEDKTGLLCKSGDSQAFDFPASCLKRSCYSSLLLTCLAFQ